MKKLLFLFSSLIFISCSGGDNEITFLEKYDGMMFQKEFSATFRDEIQETLCEISGDCVYEYNYEYFSFHNDDGFLVHALDYYVNLSLDPNEGTRDLECNYYNKKTEDIDILVNNENEFMYSERVLNLDGTDYERQFRFLAVGDSLFITWGNAKEINNYGGSNWQRSLAVISDVCTN